MSRGRTAGNTGGVKPARGGRRPKAPPDAAVPTPSGTEGVAAPGPEQEPGPDRAESAPPPGSEGRYGGSRAEELRAILRAYGQGKRHYLQWGVGEGTGILLDHARSSGAGLFLAIDHEPDTLKAVARDLPEAPFLHLRCLSLEGDCGSPDDQTLNYASYPSITGVAFDVVHIDGRRRVECALWAAWLLHDDGVVILHDHHRRRYRIIDDILECVERTPRFAVYRKRPGIPPGPRVWPFPAPPASADRTAVVVPLSGAFARREWRIAEPSVSAYARRIGARLLPLDLDAHDHPQLLKHAAMAAALDTEDFDRVLLMDADILIREHCPDLFAHVPRDRVGAFFEGRHLDRSPFWGFAADAYGPLDGPIDSRRYFNSGILVLSREHYALFDGAHLPESFYGHPENEQTFLNWLCARLGLKTFDIGPEFNLFPFHAEFGDWRMGWILHLAGGSLRPMLTRDGWRPLGIRGRSEVHQRVPIRQKWIRSYWMAALRQALDGRTVTLVLPTDLAVTVNGRVEITLDGAFRIRSAGHEGALIFFGPYLTLGPGRHRMAFVCEDDAAGASTIAVDVVSRMGERQIVPRRNHTIVPGERAWIGLDLDEEETKLEIRGFGTGGPLSFSHIEIETLRPPYPDGSLAAPPKPPD